jgi:hypothetical protein
MDRQCAPCPFRTFSATAGTKSCKYWKTCRLPETELVAPTATSDRVCRVPIVCQSCSHFAGDNCTDLSTLQDCFLVNGTLISFGASATTISNPYLTLVLGDLVLRSSSIQVIEFPALKEVRGLAGFVDMSTMTMLDLPALTYALGFIVTDAFVLSHLVLPELRVVEYSSGFGLSFTVNENKLLTYLSVPKLTHIELIEICDNGFGFVVPSAVDMTAPVGGLVVTGPRKGTSACVIQNGTDSTCPATTCP